MELLKKMENVSFSHLSIFPYKWIKRENNLSGLIDCFSRFPVKIELEELTYNLDYPLFIMDCKLGNRTYNPLESGLNDHKPQSLKMLQKYLPHLVKPEYSHNFSKKMFADIRTMESSSSSLCFRIDVGELASNDITLFSEKEIMNFSRRIIFISVGHRGSHGEKCQANGSFKQRYIMAS